MMYVYKILPESESGRIC